MVKKANIEAAISNAVLDWVNTNYPEVIITTTQNESNFGNRKQVGSLGITDLILFTRKDTVLCVLFLELKTAGLGKTKRGKLGKNQIEWNSKFDTDFTASNATRGVAYGYEEAITKIREWYNEK